MYARSTTLRGDAAAMDDAIAYMRDEVLPAMQETPGFIGLSLLAERESGRCIATTSWQDEESMHASSGRVQPLRGRLADLLGGRPEVQEWEIAALHRAHEAGESACARLTWTQGDPAATDHLIERWKSDLMPRLQDLPGFCSLSLLIDRASGRTVGTVSFADRGGLGGSRAEARRMRDEFTAAMDRQVLDVAEMDLVIAHLRVPEMV